MSKAMEKAATGPTLPFLLISALSIPVCASVAAYAALDSVLLIHTSYVRAVSDPELMCRAVLTLFASMVFASISGLSLRGFVRGIWS